MKKQYTVVMVYAITQSLEIEAESPELAADEAARESWPSLCHQCARDLEFCDTAPFRVDVLDEDGDTVYTEGE